MRAISVTYEVREGIAHIGFDRPEKHNAFRDEDLAALSDALRTLDADDDVDAGILFGHGRSFSSGGDVRARLLASVEASSSAGRVTEREAFLECTNWKPIIAAVHGYCLGHALSTALLCDHVVAARNATFQVTETKLGLALPSLLPRLGHAAFANDVSMTGRMFTAEEALAGGMLSRLVADDEHISGAEALAREILDNPQRTVREYVRARRERIAEEIARFESAEGMDWGAGEDAKAAVAEQLERMGKQR